MITIASVITGAEATSLGLGILALLLLLIAVWLLLRLLRQNGRILTRLEALERTRTMYAGAALGEDGRPSYGLPVGTDAPGFALTGVHDETMTLEALRAAGNPVLLLFSGPDCEACRALLPDVAQWQRDYASRLTVAVITSGGTELSRDEAATHRLAHVLLQEGDEVAQTYGSPGAPSAVLIAADGTVQTPIAAGATAIRSLVGSAVGVPAIAGPGPAQQMVPSPNGGSAPAMPSGVAVGSPAPVVRLSDINGKTVRLSDFRGSQVALVFWNTDCGFCQQMLPDLKRWEETRSKSAPKLLVVSSGSMDDNRTMGLRSPVLLDQTFATGAAFGANGTPMAVMIDQNGNVASGTAAGAEQVFDLLGGRPQVPAPEQ
jgi:peroxiredoxin